MTTFNPQEKNKPIRLYGKARTRFRQQVYEHYSGICTICNTFAPLYDSWNPGTVRHIIGHGAGGGDTIDNVEWAHWHCHMGADHSPRWTNKEEDYP